MKKHLIRHTMRAGLEREPGAPLEPVKTTLIYRDSDPYAVTLVFRRTAQHLVVWTFARDLLTDGFDWPVGDGDVRITPNGYRIWVAVASPGGRARFAFTRTDLEHAHALTLALVPEGHEAELIDWDAELAKLREVA